MRRTVTLLLLLVFALPAFSQTGKVVTYQNLFWARYYNRLVFNKQWSIHSEVDGRWYFPEMAIHQLVLRTQGRFKFHENAEAGIGFALFHQYPHDPDIRENPAPELRPQQDITLRHPFKYFQLSHRYLLEQRFFRNADHGVLLSGYRFNFRFRYRLQLEAPICKKVKLVLFEEIMLNFGRTVIRNVFDQNRIYAGIQIEVLKPLSLELGYLNWYQQRNDGDHFFDRDIVRLSIFHTIPLLSSSPKN